MSQIDKARFWCALGYPENMIENWQLVIGDTLQIPIAYCIHDKGLDHDGDARKLHVHFILAFPNTTTKKHAQEVINLLNSPGKKAFMPVQAAISVRKAYDYLIHDTDESRKQEKYQFSRDERICVNQFDIGVLEQVSVENDFEMYQQLKDDIIEHKLYDIIQLDFYIKENYDTGYMRCKEKHLFHLAKYCDACYNHLIREGVILPTPSATMKLSMNKIKEIEKST